MSCTQIEPYPSNGFNPPVKIVKKAIDDVRQLLHGAYVGKLSDGKLSINIRIFGERVFLSLL